MFKYIVVLGFVSACLAAEVDRQATIRTFKNNLNYDGSYEYQYETTNGIGVQEKGVGGQYATGSAQYYAPDGTLIRLGYLADDEGFHPQGDHLPVSPPIPEYILRALEWIRTHPQPEEPLKPTPRFS